MGGPGCITCHSSIPRNQFSDAVAYEGEAIAQHIESVWARQPGMQHTERLAALVRTYSGAEDTRTVMEQFTQTPQGRFAFALGTMATVGHYWIALSAQQQQQQSGSSMNEPLVVLFAGIISTLLSARIANCLAMGGCNVLAWLSLLGPLIDLAVAYYTMAPDVALLSFDGGVGDAFMGHNYEGHPSFPDHLRNPRPL